MKSTMPLLESQKARLQQPLEANQEFQFQRNDHATSSSEELPVIRPACFQFLAKCKWTTYWPARVIDTFWNLFSELQKTRSGNARNDADFKEKSAKWSRGIVAGWQQEWIPPKWRTWRKWGKRMSLLWNFKCVYNLSKIFKSILQKLQLLMATRSVGILSTTIDFLTWTRAQSSRKKLL